MMFAQYTPYIVLSYGLAGAIVVGLWFHIRSQQKQVRQFLKNSVVR